jgi:hypothetical protein
LPLFSFTLCPSEARAAPVQNTKIVFHLFASIDHALLKGTFRRLFKDGRLPELLDRVVDGSNAQEPVQEWFAGDGLFRPAERRRLPFGNMIACTCPTPAGGGDCPRPAPLIPADFRR